MRGGEISFENRSYSITTAGILFKYLVGIKNMENIVFRYTYIVKNRKNQNLSKYKIIKGRNGGI